MNSCITFQDVSFHYENAKAETAVFAGSSFAIPLGQRVGISGPSGSGKSTVLSLVGGLLKVSSGRIEVLGETLNRLDDKKLTDFRLRNMGFVFQAHHLIPTLTVWENTAITEWASPLPASYRRRGREVLDCLGLGDKLDRYPAQLSGGEMQRVGIARAMYRQPRIIIADEPTGNLDTANSARVLDIFMQLCAEQKVTALIASHDRDVIRRSERHLMMTKSGLVEGTLA